MIRHILLLAVLLFACCPAFAGVAISFTAPTQTQFTAPASFTVTAQATATLDGERINSNKLYRDGTLIASSITANVSSAVSNLPAGTYYFSSTATSSLRNTNTAGITVRVLAPGANPPTVSLGSITGTPFIAPATLGLSATAADSDGTISKVEFYSNGSLVATDTTSPYAYSWTGVAAGTYSITARAYDNSGNATTSSPGSITVNTSSIYGYIDDVRLIDGTYQLLGWACSMGRDASIDVHVYMGGAAGTGTFGTSGTANQASEPGVASACQANGANYRFSIPLTAAIRQQFANQKIYVHGISPVGAPNSLLQASGVFSVPAPLSLSRKYVYDSNQRLCKTIEPETGATVVDYDANGNVLWSASGLTTLTDPASCNRSEALNSGRVVQRSYDARNRVASLRFPDGKGDQDWTYTKDGLPDAITTRNSAASVEGGTPVINGYAYNERRLLKGESVSQPGWYTWSVGYGFDANGNQKIISYPSGLDVDFAPNALGQSTSVTGGGLTFATAISYYPNGALRQFTYGNGVVHAMTQNTRQLPSRSSDLGGPNVPLDFTYSYDENGNVTGIVDGAQGAGYNRSMTYDTLDRLSTATSPQFGGNGVHTFQYDALDNIRSWKLPGVKDYANYIYDANNRLISIRNSGGAALVGLDYDPQGNLHNKNGQAYDFDYGNRLRNVPNQEAYRYDAQGRRVFAWAPNGNLLSMYSLSGQVLYQKNERVPGIDVQEDIYLSGSLLAMRHWLWNTGAIRVEYQHTDALGSPVAVTNASAAVIDRTQYEPFGAVIGKPVAQGIGFTGHVMDAQTGLTYMQQRYYDPGVGRFLSVDPVSTDRNTGNSFDRYTYAGNNPYSYLDPSGEAKEAVWLVRLVDGGVQKVARISKEMAVEARRRGENILANRRQVASQIERAAHGPGARRDVAHELKDGSGMKGLPHYQTKDVWGHAFWGKLAVAAVAVSGTLNKVAEAAEYIPDPIPQPGDAAATNRWNSMMGVAAQATGLTLPGVAPSAPNSSGYQTFSGYVEISGRVDAANLKRKSEELANSGAAGGQ